MMTGFQLAFSTASPGSMARLGDGQLKGIVHFKLFVAVQGSGETIEKCIDSVSPLAPFSCTDTPSVETVSETIGTDGEVESVVIVQVGGVGQHSIHGTS